MLLLAPLAWAPLHSTSTESKICAGRRVDETDPRMSRVDKIAPAILWVPHPSRRHKYPPVHAYTKEGPRGARWTGIGFGLDHGNLVSCNRKGRRRRALLVTKHTVCSTLISCSSRLHRLCAASRLGSAKQFTSGQVSR